MFVLAAVSKLKPQLGHSIFVIGPSIAQKHPVDVISIGQACSVRPAVPAIEKALVCPGGFRDLCHDETHLEKVSCGDVR